MRIAFENACQGRRSKGVYPGKIELYFGQRIILTGNHNEL